MYSSEIVKTWFIFWKWDLDSPDSQGMTPQVTDGGLGIPDVPPPDSSIHCSSKQQVLKKKYTYFDKSWNKIWDCTIACTRMGEIMTDQTGTQNWIHLNFLSGALPTELSATLPVSRVSDPPLSPGEEWTRNPWLEEWTIWWGWLNQCGRHIPQKKNYWRKSEEYKLTWSYFDQSQVRISELWAGITVWGVSGLLASHTLTVWSPVIKKIV